MNNPGPGITASAVRNPNPWRMLWVTLAWGSCFVAISIGLQDAPLLWLAALRALLAGVALLLATDIQHTPLPRDRNTWIHIACLGLVNVALVYTAIVVGGSVIERAVRIVVGGTVVMRIGHAHTLYPSGYVTSDEALDKRYPRGVRIIPRWGNMEPDRVNTR